MQASDDPPLTQQGTQQAHELGLRLQVSSIASYSMALRMHSFWQS